MRVVFFCEQYPPVLWDGAGTYTATIAPALAAQGHDVHVLCCQGRRISEEQRAGVSVHRRPLLRLPIGRLLGRYAQRIRGRDYPRDSIALRASLAASYAFWCTLLGLHADIIETQDGETRALLFALFSAVPLLIRLHTPTMLDVRLQRGRLTWRGWIADRLDRMSADRAEVLVATTPLIVETLRPYKWLRGRDPTVIEYPFDPTAFVGAPSPDRVGNVVLVVGRIEHRKGQDVLVEAVAQLRAEGVDVEVLFIGDAAGTIDGIDARHALEQRARRAGVRCQFLGAVPHEELPAAYARARVVVVPSRFESFSYSAMEGMAAGRPVVCTSMTGVAPYVERWNAGAVVPPDDASKLAEALRPFLCKPDDAVAAGERGRRGVIDEFDPARIAARQARAYEMAYSRALAQRAGRRTSRRSSDV